MGSISLPALHVNPPEQQNPLNTLATLMQMKNAQQQNQMGQIDLQQKQLQLKDQQSLRTAAQGVDWSKPDAFDQVMQKAQQSGVSPQTMQTLATNRQAFLKSIAETDDATNKATLARNNMLLGHIDALKGITDPQQRADATKLQASQIISQGLVKDPQTAQMVQAMAQGQMVPNDEQLKSFESGLIDHNTQIQNSFKEREVAAQELAAQGRKEQGDAALAKNAPLPAQQISFMNKQLQNRYQVLNPGQSLPPEYTVPQGANRQNYEDIDKSLSSLENAATARANRIQTQGNQNDIRRQAQAEKSYQFNSNQLEKVAAPVDQAIARISKLQDSIAQHNPQADSLIAPELLSVMAGGSGSGLRMNEAEISRVVGGRTAWESLQASLNKWSADPTHAQIPDAQRKQISDLVNAVDAKLKLKQTALDEARQGLINSDDPAEHKRIVVKARSAMMAIDQGTNQQQSSPSFGGFDWSKFPKVNQ